MRIATYPTLLRWTNASSGQHWVDHRPSGCGGFAERFLVRMRARAAGEPSHGDTWTLHSDLLEFMKIRLLFVWPRTDDPGAEWLGQDLAEQLPNDHIEPCYCMLEGPPIRPRPRLPGPEHCFRLRGRGDWGCLVPLQHWTRRQTVDLVHLWQGAEFPAVWCTLLTAGRPLVVSVTQTQPPSGPIPQIAWRVLAGKTAAVVTELSADSRPRWPGETTIGGLPPRSAVLQVGSGTEADGAEIRDRVGAKPAAHLIGMFARLEWGQGIKEAIWSADLIKCVREDVHLVIVGRGSQAWRMGRFCRQCRVADRVHFLPDLAPQRLMPHLTCLWQPQWQPGSLACLLLAMRAGVPVIASDVPWHRSWIRPGETGLLVPAGNRAALARATLRLLTHAELRHQLSTGAVEMLSTQQSSRDYVADYVQLYRSVVGKSHRGTLRYRH